jgi:hypothetical protein
VSSNGSDIPLLLTPHTRAFVKGVYHLPCVHRHDVTDGGFLGEGGPLVMEELAANAG